MKFVIQRVTEASVEVDEKIIGEIANGYLVLIGVGQEEMCIRDRECQCQYSTILAPDARWLNACSRSCPSYGVHCGNPCASVSSTK